METLVLTPEEFANYLKISKTTESEWRRKEILVAGVHYIKVERTIRYFVNDDLIANLFECLHAKLH